MRAALLQLNCSDDPAENLETTKAMIKEAAQAGAAFVLTPEVTNIVSASRSHQNAVLHTEADDPTLAGLREVAAECGIWLLIGSLALKTDDPAGRFANRSFLIGPDSEISARYQKMHMFDVELGNGESYRESDGFQPGDKAVLANTPLGKIGMTICYDLRFPYLYRSLAQAGAEVIVVPSAFTVPTGQAHWEALLRARAIETGCYILAPAQVGLHRAKHGKPRRTYGHSLAVSPWGEILSDSGDVACITFVDLDLGQVYETRKKIPSILDNREYSVTNGR